MEQCHKTSITFIPGWGSNGGAFRHFNTALEKNYLDWSVALDEAYWEHYWSTLEEGAIVVAWSLGTLLAIKAAIQFPHKIKKIGLMAGTACLLEDDGYKGIAHTTLRTMRQQIRRSHRKIVDSFAKHAAGKQVETMPSFLAMVEKFSAEELDKGLLFFEQTDLRSQLNHIQCPVALWHGQEDSIVPVEQAYFIRKKLRNSVLHTFPAEHLWPLNPSAEIIRSVQLFMEPAVREQALSSTPSETEAC